MKRILAITALLLFLGVTSAVAQQKFGGLAPDCKLVAPNAFTPNDDGVNDNFYLTVAGNCKVQKFEMKVFDRWGRLVFESNNPTDQWNGTYDGQALKEGVYLWQCTIVWGSETNSTGISETKKGSLVLIR